MWPNARIGVMGGEQAASVLAQVESEKWRRDSKGTWPAEQEEAFKKKMQVRLGTLNPMHNSCCDLVGELT